MRVHAHVVLCGCVHDGMCMCVHEHVLCECACMCMCMCICVGIGVCLCLCVCMHVCVPVCVCVCACGRDEWETGGVEEEAKVVAATIKEMNQSLRSGGGVVTAMVQVGLRWD
jgi:hypothetical protein